MIIIPMISQNSAGYFLMPRRLFIGGNFMGKNDSPQVRDLKKCAAEYNPRKISSDELRRLKKALLEMGDLSGIIKNVATGTLIGGHQRLKVLPFCPSRPVIIAGSRSVSGSSLGRKGQNAARPKSASSAGSRVRGAKRARRVAA